MDRLIIRKIIKKDKEDHFSKNKLIMDFNFLIFYKTKTNFNK
jgi:hypothetical protein